MGERKGWTGARKDGRVARGHSAALNTAAVVGEEEEV